jgi:hypothetical protein
MTCWSTMFAMIVLQACGNSGPPQRTNDYRKMSQAELFSAKIRCAEQGRSYSDREDRERVKGLVRTPVKFAYSERLNTCLYESGYILIPSGAEHKSLIDLLTGYEIAEYHSQIDRSKASSQEVEAEMNYMKKRKELLGE